MVSSRDVDGKGGRRTAMEVETGDGRPLIYDTFRHNPGKFMIRESPVGCHVSPELVVHPFAGGGHRSISATP